ncbi:SafA/ExsA family spore coat assembly protein [Thalassobacillus sp. CUG 92003]|uniref:SafA/ExsA family spore coat assembly protein n=1 Tax=Thalassobacillus sp. CUG 92003 TaxID=2736641 RepID=UPI0015E79CDF|nr:SafA/ExsA family spore coat assembly protein [Thalassobacillus sp. CUG 92003]
MRIHIVQKGDTLWKISQKYGVNFEELKKVNSHLSNPDMIMPGMKIKVPQQKKQVKKEAPKAKEMPKHPSQKPYKDTSPKPIPVVKEDEKPKKPKEQPKEMPKEKPAEKPMMPFHMNMPVQMPTMENQWQNYYTTLNLPQMTYQPPEAPKEKKAEKADKEGHEMKGEHVAPQQSMPMPMMPYHHPPMPVYCGPPMPPNPWIYGEICCYPQPGYPHHGQMPMQGQMPMVEGAEDFDDDESENQMMEQAWQPQQHDCGCGPQPQPMHQVSPYAHHPMMHHPGMMMPMQGGHPQHPMHMPQQGNKGMPMMMPQQGNQGMPMMPQQGNQGMPMMPQQQGNQGMPMMPQQGNQGMTKQGHHNPNAQPQNTYPGPMFQDQRGDDFEDDE